MVNTQSINAKTETSKTKLTQVLVDLFKYFVTETKGFVDKEFEAKIKDYVADLGKTKDELKNLVQALDGLDFADDGKIDVKTVTAKIASNEAAAKELKDAITRIDASLTDIKKDIQTQIDELKTNIKEISTKSNSASSQEIEDLKSRVSTIEEILNIDVEEVKKSIQF